jgi:hypothetical protein
MRKEGRGTRKERGKEKEARSSTFVPEEGRTGKEEGEERAIPTTTSRPIYRRDEV